VRVADLEAAVLAEPGDDNCRLVLADFLDEHGEYEHAEFVRVQLELERLGRPWQDPDGSGQFNVQPIPKHLGGGEFVLGVVCGEVPPLGVRLDCKGLSGQDLSGLRVSRYAPENVDYGPWTDDDRFTDVFLRYDEHSGPKSARRRRRLRKREVELLTPENFRAWFFEALRPWWHNPDWVVADIRHRQAGPLSRFTFPGLAGGWQWEFRPRRGFLGEVSLPCDAWLKHGAALVARLPLGRVMFADKDPRHAPRQERDLLPWHWHPQSGPFGHAKCKLPDAVYAHLTGARDPRASAAYEWHWQAVEDLSRAALLLARK
jgi:uncharacterized protein (TIGR02996 family)